LKMCFIWPPKTSIPGKHTQHWYCVENWRLYTGVVLHAGSSFTQSPSCKTGWYL